MVRLKFRVINNRILFPETDRISFDAVFFRKQETRIVADGLPNYIATTMINIRRIIGHLIPILLPM
jgi:hypothetical protein